MALSIIIPTLNEHKQIEALIPYLKSHILNQKVEIIVVDAFKSNDDMKAICLQHDVLYYKCSKSQRAAQMNFGAHHANYEVLFFLHADVLPPPHFDVLILNALGKVESGCFAYKFSKPHLLASINAYFTKYNSRFTGGGDQGLFIVKEVFQSLGGYDEQFDVMEDFAFFRTLKKADIKFIVLPERAIVSSRKYEQHNYWKINWANLQMIRAFERNESPEELKNRYTSLSIGRS